MHTSGDPPFSNWLNLPKFSPPGNSPFSYHLLMRSETSWSHYSPKASLWEDISEPNHCNAISQSQTGHCEKRTMSQYSLESGGASEVMGVWLLQDWVKEGVGKEKPTLCSHFCDHRRVQKRPEDTGGGQMEAVKQWHFRSLEDRSSGFCSFSWREQEHLEDA